MDSDSKKNSETIELSVRDSEKILSFSVIRTQWLLGEWHELANVDIEKYEPNSDNAKIALMVGSACLQLKKIDEAKDCILQALKWGCSLKLAAQIVVSGVYNTLGRIAALRQDENAMLHNFNRAVNFQEGIDCGTAAQTRAAREMISLGLVPQVASFMTERLNLLENVTKDFEEKRAVLNNLTSELKLLKKNLSSESFLSRHQFKNKITPVQVAQSKKVLDSLSRYTKGEPTMIVVAGMRHSGSTALFNLIRLSLLEQKISFQSGYSEHADLKKITKEKFLLLKTHEIRDDIISKATFVVTTIRDLRNTVASAKRRRFPLCEKLGVVEYAKYNRQLHDVWSPFSDYEFQYEYFIKDPLASAFELLQVLGLDACDVKRIVSKLNNIPLSDYASTLLSPTHITDPKRILSYEDSLSSDEIQKISIHAGDWLEKYQYD